MNFQLPLTLDILEKFSDVYYYVDFVYDCNALPQRFNETVKAFKEKSILMILDEFSIFYSILKNFDKLEISTRDSAWKLILLAMEECPREIRKLNSLQDGDESVVNQQRLESSRKKLNNSIKMFVYLSVQFANKFENALKTAESQSLQAVKKKGKKTSSTSSNQVTNFDWSSQRDSLVFHFYQIVQSDLTKLWSPSFVDDAMLSAISNLCLQLIEIKDTMKVRSLKDSIFQVLGVLISKYNMLQEIQGKFVAQLEQNDLLASHLPGILVTYASEYNIPKIIPSILFVIGETDTSESYNNNMAKNYATFLTSLVKLKPDTMFANISSIMPLLDDKNYTMRNSILIILGDIILDSVNSEKQDNIKAYEDYIEIIESHCFDVNAFVRVKCLQIICSVVNSNLMPLTKQSQVLTSVVSRLQDISSSVRKSAVACITMMLLRNPFMAKISLEDLQKSLIEEQTKLEVLIKDSQSSEEKIKERKSLIRDMVEHWGNTEAEIKQIIDAMLEERCQDGDLDADKGGDRVQDDQGDVEMASAQDSVDLDENSNLDLVSKEILELLNNTSTVKSGVKLLMKAQLHWPCEMRFKMSPKKGGHDMSTSLNVADTSSLDTDPSGQISDQQQQSQEEVELEMDVEDAEDLCESDRLLRCVKNFFIVCKVIYNSDNTDNEIDIGSTSSNNSLIAKQNTLINFVKNAINFGEQLDEAIKIITHLIYSKINSDVLEAITFFTACYRFGIAKAIVAVSQLLALIWSKEEVIRKAVVDSYKTLYLTTDKGTERGNNIGIAQNLIDLLKSSKVGEAASLEQLISEFIKSQSITTDVLNALWDFFTERIPESTQQDSDAALLAISMAASINPNIIRANFDLLIDKGLGPRAYVHLMLVVNVCKAIGKLQIKDGNNCRLPKEHRLFEKLTDIMIKTYSNSSIPYWILASEYVIEIIYKLAENPDILCEQFVHSLNRNLEFINTEDLCGYASMDDTVCVQGICTLIRLLSILGTVAHYQMVHVDVTTQAEMKRRSRLKDEAIKEKKDSNKNQDSNNTDSDDEMDVGGPENDDIINDRINLIVDQELLYNPRTLLTKMKSLIGEICNKPLIFDNLKLQSSAVLALTKFMNVSPTYCEENLQLLFTLLEKSDTKIIRGNIIIALNDLSFRYPNLLQPWTSSLYARLRDDSPFVRQKTLMVLTHLILKDMIKVNGEISEIAVCTIDSDSYISGLSRNFFTELSVKGNKIYNVISDILSHLTDQEKGIAEKDFKTIMKYLFSFIQLERQSESLVIKLCQRFNLSNKPRQWRDVSFCLAQLSFSERSFTRLIEFFPNYKEKMIEDQMIFTNMMTIVSVAKKSTSQSLKSLAQEFEEKLKSVVNMPDCSQTRKSGKRARRRTNNNHLYSSGEESGCNDDEEEEEEGDSEDCAEFMDDDDDEEGGGVGVGPAGDLAAKPSRLTAIMDKAKKNSKKGVSKAKNKQRIPK